MVEGTSADKYKLVVEVTSTFEAGLNRAAREGWEVVAYTAVPSGEGGVLHCAILARSP